MIGNTAEFVVSLHDSDVPAFPKVVLQMVRNEKMHQLCFCALPQSRDV